MAKRVKGFQVSFRVGQEVKEAVERAAKDDARTVSSYAESLVMADLRKKGYLEKPEPKRKAADT